MPVRSCVIALAVLTNPALVCNQLPHQPHRPVSDHHTPTTVSQLANFGSLSILPLQVLRWPKAAHDRRLRQVGATPNLRPSRCAKISFVLSARLDTYIMLFSKEYVGYL